MSFRAAVEIGRTRDGFETVIRRSPTEFQVFQYRPSGNQQVGRAARLSSSKMMSSIQSVDQFGMTPLQAAVTQNQPVKSAQFGIAHPPLVLQRVHSTRGGQVGLVFHLRQVDDLGYSAPSKLDQYLACMHDPLRNVTTTGSAESVAARAIFLPLLSKASMGDVTHQEPASKMTAQPKKLNFATENRSANVPEGGRHLVRGRKNESSNFRAFPAESRHVQWKTRRRSDRSASERATDGMNA
jgi:hypothetical protein